MNGLTRYQDPELMPPRLSTLRDEIDRLFDLSFPSFTREMGLLSNWSPALDIHQDKDNVFVRVELPGMKKEDINISWHEGVLSISGERKREEETKEGETFRTERYFGRFHRSVTLPSAVDVSQVKALYRDGILEVTCPKAEEAKPKQIEVSVS